MAYSYTLIDEERAKVRRRARWLWRSEGGARLGWLPTIIALLVILASRCG